MHFRGYHDNGYSSFCADLECWMIRIVLSYLCDDVALIPLAVKVFYVASILYLGLNPTIFSSLVFLVKGDRN